MRALTFPILLMLFFTSTHANAQASSGYYLLEAMNSRKCAHVQAALQTDGATISQWECRDQKTVDPAPYFQWDKVNVGGEYFMLRARHSGKCAQVNGASNENGAPITQWGCQRDRAHFHWKQTVAENRAGDPYYYIVNRASGKCMHVHGGGSENGALITQWDCVNQSNVKWMVIRRGPID
jgi:Ricin-type beta-trefoil lectin domain-like